jgi:DNA mismatch repair protein MutL
MSKIRILPEQLANQIAAGEVVERPASVVKELVENSLDAGATRIEVEIEGGGTRLIRIIDNGEGMEEDDLLMSLERHGTSKIKTEDDLGAIASLGFRGEALPSIGSVSKLTLTSRIKGAELGTQVVLEYGRLTKVHEFGCSFGTTVEVRSLFGNTPARRKFLRTTRTELGHIEEVVKNYALGCPEISFILRVNGRDSLFFDTTLSLEQRFSHLMRYQGSFIEVSQKQNKGFKRHLSGFLVPPEKVTVGPSRLRIFVNGRVVRDRMISHAVFEGLRGFLMKGKNPSGLIHLRLDNSEIDVNVHPAKHEIRFHNARDVHSFVSQTIAGTMAEHQRHLQSSIFHPGQSSEIRPLPLPGEPTDVHGLAITELQSSDEEVQSIAQDHGRPPRKMASQTTTYTGEAMEEGACKVSQPLFRTAEPIEKHHQNPLLPEQKRKGNVPQPRAQSHNLMVIGQLDNLYIFCKNSEGLVVIDQHAAHERLLYEKLRSQYLGDSIARQTLMFPETVELSVFQSQLVEKNSEQLERMGFSFRNFGGNTFVISAIPALAGTINGRQLFLDILEQFGSESNQTDQGGLLDNILATMACRSAVKAGTGLTEREIDNLLDQMARADLFSHCPHGRPVVKQFTTNDVKKWFYRT